jgi:ABC-type nitrate/sulfonate/bicarbonate transport system substrate-binding protein
MAGSGFVVATSGELAQSHPEKVLMVKNEFARERHGEHLALIAALIEACAFCDETGNSEEIANILSSPHYLGAPLSIIRASMGETFALGNNRFMHGTDFHIFSRNNTNEPGLDKAMWVMRSLQENPATRESAAFAAIRPADLFRPDIYREALSLNPHNHEKPHKDNRHRINTPEVSLHHR